MSVKYCLPVPVFHFWPTSTHPAARSLCDSWAICCNWESVISMYTRWEVSRMSEESRPTVSDDGFDEWMLGSCLWQWRRDAGLRLCRWQWHCIEDVFTLQWRGLDTGWVNYQFSTRTLVLLLSYSLFIHRARHTAGATKYSVCTDSFVQNPDRCQDNKSRRFLGLENLSFLEKVFRF